MTRRSLAVDTPRGKFLICTHTILMLYAYPTRCFASSAIILQPFNLGDEHPHPNTESAKPDTVRSYHGSCSSSTSSQDGYDPRRHSTLFRPPSHPYSNYTRQSNNNGTSNHHKYGSDFVSSSLYQRRKMNHRYEKPEPHKEISVPQWRKLPYPSPFDYARRLEGNCSPPRFHLISPPNSANQSTCNYTVSIGGSAFNRLYRPIPTLAF